jgi:hypothetical protein
LPGRWAAPGNVVSGTSNEEETMTKLLIGVLAAALLIPAGWSLAGGIEGDDDRAFTAGTTTTTTGRTTTTERDRRAVKADRGRRDRGRRARVRRDDRIREAGEDVRGPCDEAEHRNDPRCTGTAGGDDDRSGPGRGGDDDDRSGRGGGSDD